jgi:hypothetical protein
LLDLLSLTPGLLRSLPTVPVPARGVRALFSMLGLLLPFDEEFYAASYPDLAEAKSSGAIPDLHKHFVEHGFIEGRFGSRPQVDEAFYLRLYPDVGAAIARGAVGSAYEHYLRSGAGEGRIANPAEQRDREIWQEIFGSL